MAVPEFELLSVFFVAAVALGLAPGRTGQYICSHAIGPTWTRSWAPGDARALYRLGCSHHSCRVRSRCPVCRISDRLHGSKTPWSCISPLSSVASAQSGKIGLVRRCSWGTQPVATLSAWHRHEPHEPQGGYLLSGVPPSVRRPGQWSIGPSAARSRQRIHSRDDLSFRIRCLVGRLAGRLVETFANGAGRSEPPCRPHFRRVGDQTRRNGEIAAPLATADGLPSTRCSAIGI